MKWQKYRKAVVAGLGMVAMLMATFYGVSQEEINKYGILIIDGIFGFLTMASVYWFPNDQE